MANTALPHSCLAVTHDVLCYPPINSIDSKCHTKKLKSSRTCLIGYSDFILCEWFLIAWGADIHTQTNMHTDFPDKRIQHALGLKVFRWKEGVYMAVPEDLLDQF